MRDLTFLSQDQRDRLLWEQLVLYAKEMIHHTDKLKRMTLVREEGTKRYTKICLRLKAYHDGEYCPGIYLYVEQPDELGVTLTHTETLVSVGGLIAFLNGHKDRRAKINNSIKKLFLK